MDQTGSIRKKNLLMPEGDLQFREEQLYNYLGWQ